MFLGYYTARKDIRRLERMIDRVVDTWPRAEPRELPTEHFARHVGILRNREPVTNEGLREIWVNVHGHPALLDYLKTHDHAVFPLRLEDPEEPYRLVYFHKPLRAMFFSSECGSRVGDFFPVQRRNEIPEPSYALLLLVAALSDYLEYDNVEHLTSIVSKRIERDVIEALVAAWFTQGDDPVRPWSWDRIKPVEPPQELVPLILEFAQRPAPLRKPPSEVWIDIPFDRELFDRVGAFFDSLPDVEDVPLGARNHNSGAVLLIGRAIGGFYLTAGVQRLSQEGDYSIQLRQYDMRIVRLMLENKVPVVITVRLLIGGMGHAALAVFAPNGDLSLYEAMDVDRRWDGVYCPQRTRSSVRKRGVQYHIMKEDRDMRGVCSVAAFMVVICMAQLQCWYPARIDRVFTIMFNHERERFMRALRFFTRESYLYDEAFEDAYNADTGMFYADDEIVVSAPWLKGQRTLHMATPHILPEEPGDMDLVSLE